MNELQIIFQAKRVVAVPDNRYRLVIDLKRSDRPLYWNFLCMNCGSKIAQMVNREVYGFIGDFYDTQDLNNSGIEKHCKGTLPDGLPCQYSYFFNIH